MATFLARHEEKIYLNDRIKEQVYWTCAMQSYYEFQMQYAKSRDVRRWMNSAIISLENLANALFHGADKKQINSVIHKANDMQPVLKPKIKYTKEPGCDKPVKEADVFTVVEYAVEYCKACAGKPGCELRDAFEALDIPIIVESGPCPYAWEASGERAS